MNSLLRNLKISSKILAIVAVLATIGLVGMAYLSFEFNDADNSYSDFVANDNAGVLAAARASSQLRNIAYRTYQISDAATSPEQRAKLVASIDEASPEVVEFFDTAIAGLPQGAGELKGFKDRAVELKGKLAEAVEVSLSGDTLRFASIMSAVNPEVNGLASAIGDFNDGIVADIVAQSDALTHDTDTTIAVTLSIMATTVLLAVGHLFLWHAWASQSRWPNWAPA